MITKMLYFIDYLGFSDQKIFNSFSSMTVYLFPIWVIMNHVIPLSNPENRFTWGLFILMLLWLFFREQSRLSKSGHSANGVEK